MFKEWLSSSEIVQLRLPGIGPSKRNTLRYLARVRAMNRRDLWRMSGGKVEPLIKEGRGRPAGGRIEYHYSCLPVQAVAAYWGRHGGGKPQAAECDKLDLPTRPRLYDHRGRLGTGPLSTAEGGSLKLYVVDLLRDRQRYSIPEIRARCIERFGLTLTASRFGEPQRVPMPTLRAFQFFIRNLRATEAL